MKSVYDRMGEATNEVNKTVDKLKPAAHQVNQGNPNNPKHPRNTGKKPKIKPIDVKITGIDIPFLDMVNFMVMAAIAAIPAIIILILLGVALMMMIGGLAKM